MSNKNKPIPQDEVFKPLALPDAEATIETLTAAEKKEEPEEVEAQAKKQTVVPELESFKPFFGQPPAPKQVEKKKVVEQPEEVHGITPSPEPIVPDLEEITKKAYDEGFDKGFNKGLADGMVEGKKQFEEKLTYISNITHDIEGLWQNLVSTYEGQLIQLIGKIAEKVCYGKVDLDNEVVRNAILHALEIIPEPTYVEIHVNTEDYELIETIKDEFFKDINQLKQIAIVPNPAISPGGCKIETKSGEVDATIENRLNSITAALIEAGGF